MTCHCAVYADLQRVEDTSGQEAQNLQYPLADIPRDAAQVCSLLKQGSLPVSAAMAAMLQGSHASQRIVVSNSCLAQIFGLKLSNIASFDATGKATGLRACFTDHRTL